jgi:hypothetical protein
MNLEVFPITYFLLRGSTAQYHSGQAREKARLASRVHDLWTSIRSLPSEFPTEDNAEVPPIDQYALMVVDEWTCPAKVESHPCEG